MNSTNLKPILQALLVTLLWSSSFVIIKLGLDEIPPILFAGYRYTLAFIFLLPLLLKAKPRKEIKNLTKKDWTKIIWLGIIFYALTQGAQFVGLSLLPSVTVSLWLNFTSIIVAIMGVFILREIPTQKQWLGIALFLFGILIYFLPLKINGSQFLGLVVMTVGVFANAGAAVLGRSINRGGNYSPIVVTAISMGVGAIVLLVIGIAIDGISHISLFNLLLLVWMAAINTAFAFTLWNVTLRSLTAIESSIINSTMLIQIGVLAWIFLGESITTKEIIGMVVAAIGIVLVQLKTD